MPAVRFPSTPRFLVFVPWWLAIFLWVMWSAAVFIYMMGVLCWTVLALGARLGVAGWGRWQEHRMLDAIRRSEALK
ncbi:MAG: hypothetical protein NVS4B10_23450 [Myxococcales bacterium]